MTTLLSLIVEERNRIARHHEPITGGLIGQLSECHLCDPHGQALPLQAEVLVSWTLAAVINVALRPFDIFFFRLNVFCLGLSLRDSSLSVRPWAF
ncbi:hypothetical protein U14_02662 [Candidatus Moduliflexus flocculans]|uniref:Uncharacterized protein n=1 Tax=Candidatus Moduliflexus flocculans TaxID=1499966 RepID=A0A081BM02_9BACT|nr:hypothetical protein U14_02662 [Candidatus Moduliflexus flocculans]